MISSTLRAQLPIQHLRQWWHATVVKVEAIIRPLRHRFVPAAQHQPPRPTRHKRRTLRLVPRPAASVAEGGDAPKSIPARKPVTRNAKVLTGLVSAGLGISSVMGLALPSLYQDPDAVAAMYRGLDTVNLALIVPGLAATLGLADSGSLPGYLLWTGMLAYSVYTSVLYVFGLTFNAAFLFHVAVLVLSIYALIVALAQADLTRIERQFATSHIPARIAAVVLGFLGLGLGGIWTYYAARFAITGAPPQESLLVQSATGIHLSYAVDLVLLVPAYVVTTVLLWQLAPLGYLMGGMLLTAGLLQQLAYMAQLFAQARAKIPGSTAFDPNEPPIIVAYLLGAVMLLVRARSRRPETSATVIPAQPPV